MQPPIKHSRTFRTWCFAALLLTSSSFAATPSPKRGTEKDVTVAALDRPIPADREKRDEFIWNSFSKRPEIDWFHHYTTKDWRIPYARFQAALVAKARKQGREWQVLEQCLEKVPSLKVDVGRTAYLPIGAYRGTQGNMQVWVILSLWEMEIEPGNFAPPLQTDVPPRKSDGARAKPVPPAPQDLNLGHFRVFTFDIPTADLVGFVTCG